MYADGARLGRSLEHEPDELGAVEYRRRVRHRADRDESAAAAAAVPVAIVSFSSCPGSRRWTWRSTRPGVRSMPARSTTSSRAIPGATPPRRSIRPYARSRRPGRPAPPPDLPAARRAGGAPGRSRSLSRGGIRFRQGGEDRHPNGHAGPHLVHTSVRPESMISPSISTSRLKGPGWRMRVSSRSRSTRSRVRPNFCRYAARSGSASPADEPLPLDAERHDGVGARKRAVQVLDDVAPGQPAASGRRCRGPQRVALPPRAWKPWTAERATRLCSTSPTMTIGRPSSAAHLRRMTRRSRRPWVGCSPVPSPAFTTWAPGSSSASLRRADLRVAHDEDVHPHRLKRRPVSDSVSPLIRLSPSSPPRGARRRASPRRFRRSSASVSRARGSD